MIILLFNEMLKSERENRMLYIGIIPLILIMVTIWIIWSDGKEKEEEKEEVREEIYKNVCKCNTCIDLEELKALENDLKLLNLREIYGILTLKVNSESKYILLNKRDSLFVSRTLRDHTDFTYIFLEFKISKIRVWNMLDSKYVNIDFNNVDFTYALSTSPLVKEVRKIIDLNDEKIRILRRKRRCNE